MAQMEGLIQRANPKQQWSEQAERTGDQRED